MGMLPGLNPRPPFRVVLVGPRRIRRKAVREMTELAIPFHLCVGDHHVRVDPPGRSIAVLAWRDFGVRIQHAPHLLSHLPATVASVLVDHDVMLPRKMLIWTCIQQIGGYKGGMARNKELAELNKIPGVGGVEPEPELEYVDDAPAPPKKEHRPSIKLDKARWLAFACAALGQDRIKAFGAAKLADEMEEEYQRRF